MNIKSWLFPSCLQLAHVYWLLSHHSPTLLCSPNSCICPLHWFSRVQALYCDSNFSATVLLHYSIERSNHLFSKQFSVGIIWEKEKGGILCILLKNTVNHPWRENHQCTWSKSKFETMLCNTSFFPEHMGSAAQVTLAQKVVFCTLFLVSSFSQHELCKAESESRHWTHK